MKPLHRQVVTLENEVLSIQSASGEVFTADVDFDSGNGAPNSAIVFAVGSDFNDVIPLLREIYYQTEYVKFVWKKVTYIVRGGIQTIATDGHLPRQSILNAIRHEITGKRN